MTADTQRVAGAGTAGDTDSGTLLRHPATRLAAGVFQGVAGAGMLVMPAVVHGLAGPSAPLLWGAHVALGAAVALLLTLLTRTGLPPMPLAAAVGSVLGRTSQRCVDVAYTVGFSAGQAALAWFAAQSVVAAVAEGGRAPAWLGPVVAAGVLAVGFVLALLDVPTPPALLRLRLPVVGLLAFACAAAAWPAAAPGSALAPASVPGAGAAAGIALLVLYFAGVGWESVTDLVPRTKAGLGATLAGVALGASAVAAVYLPLAWLYGAAAGRPEGTPPGWARYTLSAALLTVITSYCFTNIRAAGRIVARVTGSAGPGARRRQLVVVGLLCAAFATAGTLPGSVVWLLLVPACAATAGYVMGAVAAFRRIGDVTRWLAWPLVVALAAVADPIRLLLLG
ncbi:hypothetical protein [Streptomyces sp. CB03234]|uniref:hypothetical protein n=1 Tax=Streptomyces sp. (strain CB03234) TaxID=1703937 RepID=UPI0009A1CE41|nr:hypothetical protein [Streptomyces sp. CB03234]